MIICFVKWFSPGIILIFSVIALIILLIEHRNDRDITIYSVYTDDDESEKSKEINDIK
jgi:hypothetical protein